MIHCATSVVIASALSLALMFWQSTPAQSDEATQMVRVACDARHETVFVDGIILYKGETKHDVDNTILYGIDKLPQYFQHKPGQVVCDFGLNKKILLTAGTSAVAERNNNVSISINDTHDTVDRIFFAEMSESIQIGFSENNIFVDLCATDAVPPEKKECKTRRFSTTFSPSSNYPASFDCSKAKSVAEKLICSDETLADYDRMIATAYQGELDHAPDKTVVRSQQSLWLSLERDACVHGMRHLYPYNIDEAKSCIKAASRSRLHVILGTTALK